MTNDETPHFIDLTIENKFILRFLREPQDDNGQPVYSIRGTPKDIEQLQEHIDQVFPRNAT